MAHTESDVSFRTIGLQPELVRTLESRGYESPTPIQAAVIPALLEGRDVLGQAKTGTGKTAAFALPALQQVDAHERYPQLLVVAPTRELALQVANSCDEYSQGLGRIEVACIYGGASMSDQFRKLKKGAQVVVGTPGRLVDLVKRGALDLTRIQTFVLDEADEMLRMGFLEEVEWLMERLPEERQTALFSATMPPAIHKIACRYLKDHHEVRLRSDQKENQTISQFYWPVSGTNKLDALDRILEVQDVEAAIVFVRTKSSAVVVAEALNQRGYAAAALNGDMNQASRERVVSSLRRGVVKILVATDVAARGLDVEQITHVFNYDLPHDPESYVHRIGRTGRAGREGKAFLFIPPYKDRFLRRLEAQTKQPIVEFSLPSKKDLRNRRLEKMQERVKRALEVGKGLDESLKAVESLQAEAGEPIEKIAAALYALLQKRSDRRSEVVSTPEEEDSAPERRERRNQRYERSPKRETLRERTSSKGDRRPSQKRREGMESYRLSGGRDQDIEVSGVLSAVLKATGLPKQAVGAIDLFTNHTTVELPLGLSHLVEKEVKHLWIGNQKVGIRRFKEPGERPRARGPRQERPRGGGRKDRRR